MKTKRKITSFLCLLPLLTSLNSCFTVIKPLTYNVVTPAGSSMLPFVHWYEDTTHLHTMNNIYLDSVGETKLENLGDAFFTTDESETKYDVVVYDVYQGIDLILTYDLPFKLARVYDTGNMYLMETKYSKLKSIENKDKDGKNAPIVVTNESKIAYYADSVSSTYDSPNSIVSIENYILKLYPTLTRENLVRVDNVKVAYDILLSDTGSSSSNASNPVHEVDFVFIENPRAYEAYTSAYDKENDIHYVNYHNEGMENSNGYYTDINSSMKKQLNVFQGSNKPTGVPLKGLFLRDTLEDKSYDKKMKNFFTAFDAACKGIETAASHFADALFLFGTEDEQNKRVGCNYYEVNYLQKSQKNFVTNESEYNWLNILSVDSSVYNTYYIDLEMTFKALIDKSNFTSESYTEIYSKYYKFPKEE